MSFSTEAKGLAFDGLAAALVVAAEEEAVDEDKEETDDEEASFGLNLLEARGLFLDSATCTPVGIIMLLAREIDGRGMRPCSGV